MMKTRVCSPKFAGLALLAATLGVSHAAQAQGGRDAPQMRGDFARMQARDADDMALLLALRPEQRPALTAFLQSMAPPSPPPAGDRVPGMADEPTSSDGFACHLDRMTRDSARRSEEDTRRITAARTFYVGLDAGQRRAFEALMRLRHGPGRGPGPHGPMHGGDDGPPMSGGLPPQP